MNTAPMPQYQCHKKVRALKIVKVSKGEPRTVQTHEGDAHIEQRWLLHPEDTAYGPINVGEAWFRRHQPGVPGYYVAYEDGYTSYSPVESFEEGYTRID